MTRKVSIPFPGTPVRGSKSGAPIMALLDLLGRRWALGVVWTLAENGPLPFKALQDQCESISPGILNTRLKELRAAGLVTAADGLYALTPQGRQLFEFMRPMGVWARNRWAKALRDRED
ncbi:MAG: transcriptional regulator [Alphaproteobacteria bacterium]|nr:transcriptional regulator [Alphaproteobacteria bacterium]